MGNEIQEKNKYDNTLIQFYLDLKELKEDWKEIVEDGIDIDNVMKTYEFYVKYIENDNFEDLEFEDYILFYTQDKSEFAVKHFFEKIWSEISTLLNIYDENREIFYNYDHIGLSNSIVRVPYFFTYNHIFVKFEQSNPEELKKIWEKPIIDIQQRLELESGLIEYKNNLEKVRDGLSSEINEINTLYDFIDRTRYTPFFFHLFTVSLIDYASAIGKYIDKVIVRKQAEDSEYNSVEGQFPSYKIEGKMLDELYEICNKVVFHRCDKEHFAFIINGGQTKKNQENKTNDIKHLNRFYYLVRNMAMIIPYTQYGLWKNTIFKAQNIKENIFNKKWNSITKKNSITKTNSKTENESFKENIDMLISHYADTNSAEDELAKENL